MFELLKMRVEDQYEAIDRLVSVTGAAAPLAPSGGGSSQGVNERARGAEFDMSAILTRLDGDRELLRKMIRLFLGQTQTLLPQLRAAGERGDAKALERAAHKLKGSLVSFAADGAAQAALRLEVMGRGGDLVEMPTAMSDLEREVASLQESMTRFLTDGG